ncbi:MAG: nicotinate (nicotinamide) nucleotide adenylyltransferase [Catonella sp.]
MHNTHVEMARAALANCILSEVRVMPAKIPPNKLGMEIVADSHRYEMVKLALEGEKNIFPSDFELLRDDISYTSDTLILLKEKYPDSEFYLIIGGDSVLYLEDWHEPQTIFNNAVILYASRIGSEADKCKEHIENVLKKAFVNVRLAEINFAVNAVSSTEIRKQISEGIRDAKQLGINEKVMDYILKNGLYKES